MGTGPDPSDAVPGRARRRDLGHAARSLRARVLRMLALAALVPALVFAASQLVYEYRSGQAAQREQLRLSTRLVATSVDQFVREHLAGVSLIAAAASRDGSAPDLATLRGHFPSLVTTLATDADGDIVAVEPALRALGATRRNVADRDYFRVPASRLRPYVSDAFVGRGLGTDPLVAVSAPIVRDGAFAGVVEGSIRIDSFTWLRGRVLRSRGQEVLIVDRGGRVIHASAGLPYRFLQRVGDAPFLAGAEDMDGVSAATHVPDVLGGAWVAWSELPSGWKVALFAPKRLAAKAVQRQALGMGIVLVLAVVGVLLTMNWELRRLARATGMVLEGLRATAAGDDRAAPGDDAIPVELQPVAREVRQLAGRLREANAELTDALARQQALSTSLRDAVGRQEETIRLRTAELETANRELERLTQTDPLTGVLNLRGLRAHVDGITDRTGALVAPLAVITFDVDHFKAFNDLYGHPAGDRVLRRVAAAGQAALRAEHDRIARVGGEEFVVLLPGQDLDGARRVADRILEHIRGMDIPHAGSPAGRVSVSGGVAVGQAGDAFDTLLGVADGLLYEAKATGRDRLGS